MQEKQINILFGNRVKEIRLSRNLTQENLCEIMNFNQSDLSQIENGKRSPSLLTLLSIIKALKVNPNELLNFTESYDELNLSDDINGKLFGMLVKLPTKTKKKICELIETI